MTIAYFCELCGGSVDVDDIPDGVELDSPVHACATCLPITELPLSRDQMREVAEMVRGAYLDARGQDR